MLMFSETSITRSNEKSSILSTYLAEILREVIFYYKLAIWAACKE